MNNITVWFSLQGLSCLERDYNLGVKKNTNIVEEQARCNRDEAIPLHYEPIHTPAMTLPELQMTSVSQEENGGQSWHYLSKGLLYRKGALTYIAMAKQSFGENKFLETIKQLKVGFSCYSKCMASLSN